MRARRAALPRCNAALLFASGCDPCLAVTPALRPVDACDCTLPLASVRPSRE